jgi:RNA polymerase sigma-70 factor, ECF subfamily
MSDRKVHKLPLTRSEELVLLRRLRSGDEEAFRSLYLHLSPDVLALSTRVLREAAAAEDATQEVFTRVFRGLRRFRGGARVSTWVYRITMNVCLTEIERRGRRPAPTGNVPLEVEPAEAVDPTTRIDASRILAVVDEMDPVKRASFHLYFVKGLRASEVAEVLNNSRDAVLKRLQRIRRELVNRWSAPAAAAARRDQDEREP